MAKAVEKSLSKYVWKRRIKNERVDLIKYRKKGPRLKFELLTWYYYMYENKLKNILIEK